MTQEDLARQAACSIVSIRKIESGDLLPSKDLAQLLAAALGVPETARESFIAFARDRRAAMPRAAFGAAPHASLDLPGTPAAAPNRYKLPAQLTAAIGRERDTLVASNLLRLSAVRLVTLTGPPGTGKTRLSLEVADALQDEFTDGVCFVPLAPLDHPDLVESGIAQALGARESAQQPLPVALRRFLRDKQLLLVLDNFEHLLPAAPFVADLLSTAPRVKALVSSREPLRVYGERELPVSPLALPDPEHLPATQELQAYAAVALFVERAQAVKPDFALTDANREAVAHICASLDGLPLAIEMAAARVKWYEPTVLLAQLRRQLAGLSSSARDRSPRQQSMRGAIEWSYNLLSPDEQVLFDGLGVFAGGFSASAAADVLGATLDSLIALADKSLLKLVSPEPAARFGMLEILRASALEHLRRYPAQERAIRRAHAAYYLAFAVAADAGAPPAQPALWLDQLDLEHDNLRAALSWSLEHEPDLALQLTIQLGRFWNLRSHFSESRRWQGAARLLAGDEQRMVLARQLGESCWNLGAFTEARAYLDESVQLARAQAARSEAQRAPLADALSLLGRLFKDMGLYAEAKALLEEGLELARSLSGPDAAVLIPLWRNLGNINVDLGQYADAKQCYAESLTLARRHDNRLGIAGALNNLAIAHIALQDYTAARACLREARAILEADGAQSGLAMVTVNLGRIAHRQGQYAEARADFESSLQLARAVGKKWSVAYALNNLGLLAGDLEQWPEAERYFRESLQTALEGDATPRVLDAFSGYARWLEHQGDVAGALALLSLVLTHPASEHESTERAQSCLAQWRGRLAAGESEAALARGASWARQAPETVAARLLQPAA